MVPVVHFSASLFTGPKPTMLAVLFPMSGENGVVNEACNRARAKYGLTPL